ncbi:hypothetical protein D2E51_17800 [Mycobacteroides abscessus]|uniref:Uncharacterized protein n=2 Tax=Mycobacteroides abscessus TaxID=36809 RepID=A0AB33TB59_9MYCO|nr:MULTISPECIES: hypothetical protein [Mycobacteroides]AMU58971.1 hypothetical protein A3O03_01410 [Mycobacteroides abscessus]RIS93702.1 hypothetical protein D2E51_17800 [Mycobacteroides abscessus]CPT67045.1 Uncharacterised protein [Mycobacteroides abscessus]CPT76979.1 Uncharacterised protein [Mycobacteroides abscessus]CPV17557.1 Uncharacterised protein [Mycobacteroides abscessus]
MTTSTRDALPDWMTVGAEVMQIQDRRFYPSIVTHGTVARILGRDIVVVDTDCKELLRFRRTDYSPNDDYFRRRASSYEYADSVYLYRADDPMAVAIERRALIAEGISNIARCARTLSMASQPWKDSHTADALEDMAATATQLAALIREGR